jgi:hypothetical protein
LANELPQRVCDPQHCGGKSSADERAGQYIAGIVNSAVNAGIADQTGGGQHQPQTATKVNCHNHGGREPVCCVRGRHAVGTAFADQTVDIGQGQKWARSRDDFLDEPTDPTVAESDGQREHQNANDASRATLPDEKKTECNQGWKKKRIAAQKRHDFIE